MQLLIAPKPGGKFWLFHIMGWSFISLLNFLNRQSFGVEPLSHGLISLGSMILVNAFVCLVFRELLYRLKIIDIRPGIQWIFLALGSGLMGFISGSLILYSISVYYWLAGYTSSIVFFINQVYANWLIMTLMIFLWSMIFTLTNHFMKLQKVQAEHDALNLKLKEAELTTLLSQLNPHFLFNALNNIRSLMRIDVDKARAMVTSLSELLRYSLRSNKQPFRAFKEELEIVHNYIELAQIQYEERLSFQEDVESNVLDISIPSMVVQLLVENAVRHGIDKHLGEGTLKLSAKIVTNKLMVTVINPGYISTSNENEGSTGIGIENIKRRLALSYGNEASLEVQQKAEQVEAKLILPLK
ncbi:MAG: histidine kinase [Gammaproteobacteria bacterium]|nr:histidine kinase [Gammaproteobacteria bacterium]